MPSRVRALSDNDIRAIVDGLFRGGHVPHLDKHPRGRFKSLQQPNNLPLRPEMLMRRKKPHRRGLVLLDDRQRCGLEFDHGFVAGEEAGADAEMTRGRGSVIAKELADLDEVGVELDNVG